MEDRLTGRLFSHGEYTEERRGTTLKRINWVLIVLVLIGFVIGRFIGTYFDGTFLNYGQNFGLSSPVELNLGRQHTSEQAEGDLCPRRMYR